MILRADWYDANQSVLIAPTQDRSGPRQRAFEPQGGILGRHPFRKPVQEGEIQVASDQLSVLRRQALRDSVQVGRETAKHAMPPSG